MKPSPALFFSLMENQSVKPRGLGQSPKYKNTEVNICVAYTEKKSTYAESI